MLLQSVKAKWNLIGKPNFSITKNLGVVIPKGEFYSSLTSSNFFHSSRLPVVTETHAGQLQCFDIL